MDGLDDFVQTTTVPKQTTKRMEHKSNRNDAEGQTTLEKEKHSAIVE